MNTPENLLPFDGITYFYPELFTPEESRDLFEILKNNTQWKQEPIKIMGREIMQPRLTAWYGDADKPYSYSGITMDPLSWTRELLMIKKRIEDVAQYHFTSALLNFYRDGKDSMGWHRDNEKELGKDPVIGSVSFGATRDFYLRHYKDKSLKIKVPLITGSFLLMAGSTQHYWYHSLPKSLKITEGRINITFRKIIG